MLTHEPIPNFVDGVGSVSKTEEYHYVYNPATGEVDQAARAAQDAFTGWQQIPAHERIQLLFRLKNLLEAHFEDLSRTVTLENGKTLDEAHGEMRRAIENLGVTCGIPTMMMGDFSEDIARGIDEFMVRQPVGVAAMICPFNFPGMISFWYFPDALACGNPVTVKPSERKPLTMQQVFQLVEQAGLPKGVINLLNVYTNDIPTGAFRGFGGPQGNFLAEIQLNKLAERLGIDPVELRMRNVLHEGDTFGVGTVSPGLISAGAVIEAAARGMGWVQDQGGWCAPEPQQPTETDYKRGISLAAGFKNVGFSFGYQENCWARVELFGSAAIEQVVVWHAGAEVGQGTHAAMI